MIFCFESIIAWPLNYTVRRRFLKLPQIGHITYDNSKFEWKNAEVKG